MPAARIPLIVLLCLLSGCQAAGRLRPHNAPNRLATAPDTRPGPPGTPLADPTPVPGWPESYVRPAAHVQPAQPAVQLEPLPMPSPPPVRADVEVTLPQLEEMALAFNPALAEFQARVDAARGKWVQVGLPPNTILGYAGQQLGSRGEAEQQGVYIQQEIVRGGKLRLNRAIVSREIEIAEQRLAAGQQRVLTDVRLGFYDVLIAQRRTEMTEQLVEIAAKGSETAEALFKAKEVSQIDVIRARIESQTAELLHKNARNLYAAAWSRLAAVLGRPDFEPVTLVGDLEKFVDEIDPELTLQRLLGESPEMAALLTEVERARWMIDRSRAEPVPNLDVQAIVQHDNSTGGSNANLQVSMPIPWLNRNQGGIRQAEAELIGAERAVDRLELHLQQRLAGVYQRYASARNQVEDYSKPDGILANSKTTLDFVSQGYQAGEIGYLDLLTAQRTYSQTNLAYIEALGDLWAAMIEIEGLLLKDSLDGGRAAR